MKPKWRDFINKTGTIRTALSKKKSTGTILTVMKETRMKYIGNHYYEEMILFSLLQSLVNRIERGMITVNKRKNTTIICSCYSMHIWHPRCGRSPGNSQTINKSIPVFGMYKYIHNHVQEKEIPQQRTQLRRC